MRVNIRSAYGLDLDIVSANAKSSLKLDLCFKRDMIVICRYFSVFGEETVLKLCTLVYLCTECFENPVGKGIQ